VPRSQERALAHLGRSRPVRGGEQTNNE
jgi:hypothetical protein